MHALGHSIHEIDVGARITSVGARQTACTRRFDVIIPGCIVDKYPAVAGFCRAVGPRPWNCPVRDEGVPTKGLRTPASIDSDGSGGSPVRTVGRNPAADGVLCSGACNR